MKLSVWNPHSTNEAVTSEASVTAIQANHLGERVLTVETARSAYMLRFTPEEAMKLYQELQQFRKK